MFGKFFCCSSLLFATLVLALPATARDVDAIHRSGKLVMLTFPHQDNIFVRTNIALGAMPRSGTAEHFVGIDVDIMKAFADHLDVDLEIRPVSEPQYGALIPDLLAGRGDAIASSFSITAARMERVAFSRPYYTVYTVVVTRKGEDTPTSLADLKDKIGAVNNGSSHEEYLLHAGIDDARLKRFDFSIENYLALLENDADYTMMDSTSAERFLRQMPELAIAFRTPDEVHYGIAVPKNSDLLPALDAFLDDLDRSGKLDAIIERHRMLFARPSQEATPGD